MKKSELRNIIKEEIKSLLKEDINRYNKSNIDKVWKNKNDVITDLTLLLNKYKSYGFHNDIIDGLKEVISKNS